MVDKTETGADGKLKVGDTAYPVTNISYSIDTDTSEEQFTISGGSASVEEALTPSIAVTGMSYSGSFEHAGSNEDLRAALMGGKDDSSAIIPQGVKSGESRASIVVEESERRVRFRGVIVNSRSKDIPSDDRTSETYDFVAERAYVVD